MFFSKTKKTQYENHEKAITAITAEVEKHRIFGGMCLISILRELPNDLLIHIHWQGVPAKPEYRRITVANAIASLPSYEYLRRVSCIQHDLDFGYDPNRPIAILEIPNRL